MIQFTDRLTPPTEHPQEIVNSAYPCQFCGKRIRLGENVLELTVDITMPNITAFRYIHTECLLGAVQEVKDIDFDKTPTELLADLELLDVDV